MMQLLSMKAAIMMYQYTDQYHVMGCPSDAILSAQQPVVFKKDSAAAFNL